MNKVFLGIIIVSLVGLSILASAEISEDFGGSHEVYLEKGWNLVSVYAPSSDLFDVRGNKEVINSLREKGITSIFFYDKYNEKYIQLYPDNPSKESNVQNYFLNMGDPEKGGDLGKYGAFANSAVWVYSEKPQLLKYYSVDGPLYVKDVKLKKGWNFLATTPEFKMKKLSQIKGTCTFEKYALWKSEEQKYVIFSAGERINVEGNSIILDDIIPADSDSDVGKGFLIKTTNDCQLGSDFVSPPTIPN